MAGRRLDAEQQTVLGQKESGQSSRRSQRVKTGPNEVGSASRGQVTIPLRAVCGTQPSSCWPLDRAPGRTRAGGTGSGQSLPHMRSLRHGNDPTQKLQGQQPYTAAQCQALLNKDKEEDVAFLPIPSPWLCFQQPRRRRGSQVPLGLLWLVGTPSHPPMKHSPPAPGSASSRRAWQATESRREPAQLQGLFHFLEQSSLFSSGSGWQHPTPQRYGTIIQARLIFIGLFLLNRPRQAIGKCGHVDGSLMKNI